MVVSGQWSGVRIQNPESRSQQSLKQLQLTAQTLIASALNYSFLLQPFQFRFRQSQLAAVNFFVIFADQRGPAPDLTRPFGELGEPARIVDRHRQFRVADFLPESARSTLRNR